MRRPIILICLSLLTTGCATARQFGDGPDVVFIVPGVGGPSGYDDLIETLQRPGRSIQVVKWGAPPTLFFLNYSNRGIHEEAETNLAARIEEWRRDHPGGRIDVIGHSAGCGVSLGAIGRLEATRVHHLILLAPSVSPGYDLRPALSRIYSQIHVFTSREDIMLAWRTRNFSTYDRVATAAAGVSGFSGDVPQQRVVQHEFSEQWRDLGHEGGHWGPLAAGFSRFVIAPLIEND